MKEWVSQLKYLCSVIIEHGVLELAPSRLICTVLAAVWVKNVPWCRSSKAQHVITVTVGGAESAEQ